MVAFEDLAAELLAELAAVVRRVCEVDTVVLAGGNGSVLVRSQVGRLAALLEHPCDNSDVDAVSPTGSW